MDNTTQTAPNTMQESINQAIVNHVEDVMFLIAEMNMSQKQALFTARESSCMGDKIWSQISDAVDARLTS